MRLQAELVEDFYPDHDIQPAEIRNQHGHHEQQTLEANLISALAHLIRKRKLIALIACLSLAAGVTTCLLVPDRYTASTRIMPPQQTQPATALLMNQLVSAGPGGALTAVAAKQLGVRNQNDIYIGLLSSRPVADAIIHKFNLMQQYRSRDMTAARHTLADDTIVTSEKNGFIALFVTNGNNARAAAMANEYTAQLRILLKTLAVTESSQRRLFYEEQLKRSKEALAGAEDNLQQIQQKEGLVQLDAQAKAMIEGMAALRAKIAAKQVEVEAIRSYSTDRNPETQLAKRELHALQQESDRLDERKRGPGSSELGLQDVAGVGLDYLRAEHEVKYRQTMFDLFLKQLDAARLDEAQEAAVIQVVEPAIASDRASSPHRATILLVAAAGGIVLGILCALLSWCRSFLLADAISKGRLNELKIAFSTVQR